MATQHTPVTDAMYVSSLIDAQVPGSRVDVDINICSHAAHEALGLSDFISALEEMLMSAYLVSTSALVASGQPLHVIC